MALPVQRWVDLCNMSSSQQWEEFEEEILEWKPTVKSQPRVSTVELLKHIDDGIPQLEARPSYGWVGTGGPVIEIKGRITGHTVEVLERGRRTLHPMAVNRICGNVHQRHLMLRRA